MKLSLEVMTDGKQKGKLLPIGLPQFVIGRDPQCQLRPASPSISKRHCALIQRDGRAYVRDFDSTNGTFVNEQQIKGEIEIKHGDMLQLGPLIFQVHLEAGAPAKPAAPGKPAAKPVAKGPPQPVKTSDTKAELPKKAGQPAGGATLSGSGSDDDIGDMLLSMGDEGGGSVGPDGIPEGSTVMDLHVPPQDPTAKEKEKPKAAANTQNAAKDILDKYMKRPR